MTIITHKKPTPIKPLPLKSASVVGAQDVPAKASVKLTAPKAMKAKQPLATITQEQVDNTTKEVTSSSEETEEVGPSVMLEEPHATVGVTMGMSRNLGNYEAFKFTVFVSFPCEPNEDAMSAAYGFAKEWVDQRVNALNEEIDSQLNGAE